jgi:hypothetical protein
MRKAKEIKDIYDIFCKIREDYQESSENQYLAAGLTKIHMVAYLTALLDFGVINQKMFNEVKKSWDL